MKRGATRDEIIRTTQDMICRNGIQAVRVDEIAQTLGISKRTLYEMFADKNDLVSSCLEEMDRRLQERIATFRHQREDNPLQQVFALMNEYIETLCRMDRSFLSDVRHKVVFAEHYEDYRTFWTQELTCDLESGRQKGFFLPDVEAATFADKLLTILLEMRQGNASQKELQFICRTLLRGAATRRGIEQIDGD